MQKYVVLEKPVGETPLECLENWRATQSPAYQGVPMTYAGRLDPLASGKLLILIDEECKLKEKYLALDKEYEFSVLFGLSTDTGDLLGLVNADEKPYQITEASLRKVCHDLIGTIELPYPKFSSKTVNGKPLHTWALENKVDDITIPTKQSTVYKLNLENITTTTAEALAEEALVKIETIAPVTDQRKTLGNDFRRSEIRPTWNDFRHKYQKEEFTLVTFRCVCSSGTYMRTLANEIAKKIGTTGLAYSIHRTKIGHYQSLPFNLGFWTKKY